MRTVKKLGVSRNIVTLGEPGVGRLYKSFDTYSIVGIITAFQAVNKSSSLFTCI
jgi:hypothetical protein